MIELAFITYNRLEYTKLSLTSILADNSEDFLLTIWDNASTDGTRDYLKSIRDSRIRNIFLSPENLGQTAAVNYIWTNSKADLLGKLDNDCIVTPGWTRIFAEAHRDIPALGVLAMWHFFPEDFEFDRAKHKIQTFGEHQIFRHPWTCGTGMLIKRNAYVELGPIQNKATTSFWLKMAKAGYINGWYFPLVFQEHLDDPRSEHCLLHTRSFDDAYKHSFGYQEGILSDIENYRKVHRDILNNLLEDPFDAGYYSDWRRWMRKVVTRVFKHP